MNEIIKRPPPGLLLFGGMLALVIGLSGIGDAELSWAAPAQNPYSQTIPTRFPDETTEPPAAPSPALIAPTRQPTSNDNQADDKPPLSATPTGNRPNSPQSNASVTPLLPGATGHKQTSQPSTQPATGPQKTVVATPPPARNQDGAPFLGTPSPTLRAALPPTTAQADEVTTVETLSPEKQTEAPASSKGSLGWIYGLAAGVILLFGGIALVRRA